MLDILYHSVNIAYRIRKITYRKCAYDIVYDIVCLYYDIVCQPTISYVDIRYPRVPRIQMGTVTAAAGPGSPGRDWHWRWRRVCRRRTEPGPTVTTANIGATVTVTWAVFRLAGLTHWRHRTGG